jgi:hypothetical protein
MEELVVVKLPTEPIRKGMAGVQRLESGSRRW